MRVSVRTEWHGWRIERILDALFPGRTRALWKSFLEERNVRTGGRVLGYGDRVSRGSVLEISEPLPPEDDAWSPVPSEGVVELVDRGERWAVVRKRAGVPTLPRLPSDAPTAAGGVRLLFPDLRAEPPREAGLVNRLDTGTVGLLLVGLDPEAAHRLRQNFANHQVEKEYIAVVQGRFDERRWLEGLVATTGGERVRYTEGLHGEGKRAVSLVVPLKATDSWSVVKVITRFGRRHQVRVQLAGSGHPILGDVLYGGPSLEDGGSIFLLWASAISFDDPSSPRNARKRVTVRDPSVPPHFVPYLEGVRWEDVS